MVKYPVLIGILACVLCAGAYAAGDEKPACATTESSGQRSGIFGFNLFEPRQARGLGDDEGGGIDRVGTMSPGQSYDSQTGMPNVVESDSTFRID